jgi:hypothetical protein
MIKRRAEMATERHSEDEIRRRAYEIWEEQGREGDPLEHWLQAKSELEAESEKKTVPGQDPAGDIG